MKNKEAVIERTGSRMTTDQTLRKQNSQRVKARLLNDINYKNTNKVRAANNDCRKRKNPESREQHLAYLRQRIKEKMTTDKKYRKQHQVRVSLNDKLRLQNQQCREQHRARVRLSDKRKLQNEQYMEQHRATVRLSDKRRLQNDKYRQQHRAKMQDRYASNPSYREANKLRARQRYGQQRERKRAVHSPVLQKHLTDRQKYWLRRSRLLAVSMRRVQLLQMRKKMESESGLSMFNIQLLFNKAEHHIKVATARVKQLHSKLRHKAEDCLQYIPTDKNPTETDMVTAFEGRRMHTSATEPYFWEQSSKPILNTSPIPVDETGQAHVYKVITAAQPTEMSSKTEVSKTWTWECNSEVCCISKEQMKGSVNLLKNITSTHPAKVTDFYVNIDRCRYETRSDCFGHSRHCTPQSGCDSLLRPTRTLSCHFPYLRSIIRRIYDLRHLSLCIKAVNHAMSNGDYNMLQAAVQQLNDAVEKICIKGTSTTTDDADLERQVVSEDTLLEHYGKSLQEVADSRGSYNTDSCDVCEQLRKDLRTLISCENLTGFNSENMQNIIDLLYQNKTEYEDHDEFLESMKICSYCVDKLRSNKDISRSCFNRLGVIPTPGCITKLNLFERTLIKFCMTCVTIVRLGQIVNKARPHSELTAALKGRIAYLPVNVAANAKFLPENLLNVDSLVLLVGGQPTQNNKIWTSLVDLKKFMKH